MKTRLARASVHATFFLALLTTISCGPSASSICSDICECQGCSEEEEKNCIDEVEDALDRAEDEGCGDQVDELLSCYDGELECIDGAVDIDGCQEEAEAVDKCTGAITTVEGPGGAGGGGVGGGPEPTTSSSGSGGAPPSSSSSSGSGGAPSSSSSSSSQASSSSSNVSSSNSSSSGGEP